MNKDLKNWKHPAILLGSLGIASIGDFIYLVVINLLVFQVVFILMIGLLADIVSLRLTIVALALIMLATAFVYILAVLNPRYSGWYQEELKEELAK